MLQIEDDEGCDEAEFFEDRGNHHGTEADGIGGDYQEGELPGESAADETIIEAGMGYGGRVLAADGVEEEVKWREDQNTPDKSDPESDLGEFHEGILRRAQGRFCHKDVTNS